jgi:hypothetical protein
MESRRMIQSRLHPQLLPLPLPLPLWVLVHPQSLEHPQFVAVKSLMFVASLCLIMLYSMRGGSS